MGADTFYQPGLDERPEEVEGALFGDGQRVPDFARHEALVVPKQLEQLLAFGDPGCMASIFRYSFPGNNSKSRILYSGPDSTKRGNGRVYLSTDEGKTWPVSKVLCPGSLAHSLLTALPDGTLGCLFETDKANRIVFARSTAAWLTSSPTARN